jgi:hypothetical protein
LIGDLFPQFDRHPVGIEQPGELALPLVRLVKNGDALGLSPAMKPSRSSTRSLIMTPPVSGLIYSSSAKWLISE